MKIYQDWLISAIHITKEMYHLIGSQFLMHICEWIIFLILAKNLTMKIHQDWLIFANHITKEMYNSISSLLPMCISEWKIFHILEKNNNLPVKIHQDWLISAIHITKEMYHSICSLLPMHIEISYHLIASLLPAHIREWIMFLNLVKKTQLTNENSSWLLLTERKRKSTTKSSLQQFCRSFIWSSTWRSSQGQRL